TKSVQEILRKNGNNALNYRQIAAKLGVDDPGSRNQIIKTLRKLQKKGFVEEIDRGKFVLIQTGNYHLGKLDMTTSGYGFVVIEDMPEDVLIKGKNLNKAFHGDLVEVYIYKRGREGKQEGEITRIVERKKTEFVGTIQLSEQFGFVEINDPKMYTDIFVPGEKIGGAKNGEKVLVEITDWPEKADSPIGVVKEVFGLPGEHNTEIHAILAQYGLPAVFPKEVEEFANALNTEIQPIEVKKRKDVRDVLTFTIDPKDAKDFDDALSFRKLENGNTEIGIHIADVSFYVQPGTVLDEEAYERATSVYLVDRVVPMLPEILSNNACSLRPKEEKYTFSAILELDSKANVIEQWFGRTVSLSDARFSYEEAQYIIEKYVNEKNASFQSVEIPENISINEVAYEVPEEIVEAIVEMDKLAKQLRKKRMRAGAISFDKVEVKFVLDENNEPEGVYFKESK